MSSPLAKPAKSAMDAALVAFHQKASHGHRIGILADALAAHIEGLRRGPVIQGLDVGCGDMRLSEVIADSVPGLSWTCVDVHPCPDDERSRDERWAKYRQFDGKTLPFEPCQFDVVTFSDVLHHAPEGARAGLLRSAGEVARHVLIKDHFEYGPVSRLALRAMDFIGNFGYGVSVPRRYFRPATFNDLCARAGLKVLRCEIGLRLYDHLPLVGRALSPRWQFIAVCTAED